ncbi:hypothetical protein VNO77_42848 [Canavalia gladiata]|uniref:Uncharacterized protein n=1 Tax=Canavalia gladiata TaxID=3824 RepID=A0AAN9PPF3_CANGL
MIEIQIRRKIQLSEPVHAARFSEEKVQPLCNQSMTESNCRIELNYATSRESEKSRFSMEEREGSVGVWQLGKSWFVMIVVRPGQIGPTRLRGLKRVVVTLLEKATRSWLFREFLSENGVSPF